MVPILKLADDDPPTTFGDTVITTRVLPMHTVQVQHTCLPGLSGALKKYWLEKGLPSGNRGFGGMQLSR